LPPRKVSFSCTFVTRDKPSIKNSPAESSIPAAFST
jgi:hypothetical protein